MKTTSVQTEGFEGILYPGNGRKDKVLIVMSGSNGGMTLTKQESELYHRNGFPALAKELLDWGEKVWDRSFGLEKDGFAVEL